MSLQTREKRLLIALAITAVVSAGIFYNIYNPSEPEIIPSSQGENETPAVQATGASSGRRTGGGTAASGGSRGAGSTAVATVTQESFQNHNQASDCWVLIEGEVYNITEFLTSSPQYEQTASEYCGTIGFEAGFLAGNMSLTQLIKDTSQNLGSIGS